ncbi:helix-turn-helix domain-containing protein [Streptomyces sp. NPDC008125]|uniref:AraC-like ligand-binding domain-containing protein n=1 Tax=Streptomyces sp. NPDC008125 TaxID=3364811 RepID=UPI0036E278ED
MSIVLTTASVPEERRLAYWREAIERALVPVAVALPGDRPFEGHIVSHRVGEVRATRVEADAYRVSRTAAHITRSPEPFVAVALQTSGTAILTQNGDQQVVANAGDLFVWDTTRPYFLDFPGRFSTHIVHIPRRMLGLPGEDLRCVTGSVFRTDQGCAAVLKPLLAMIISSVQAFSPPAANGLAHCLADVFAALVAETTEDAASGGPNARHHMVQRVREHVDENLADPTLSPESVAKAHHISVRYLHRLFEGEDTTVGRLIQRRRLEECARELARNGRTASSVSSIAQRWGFVNPTHFSRVFRDAYGLPPREWRMMRLAAEDSGIRAKQSAAVAPPRFPGAPAQAAVGGDRPGRPGTYASGFLSRVPLESGRNEATRRTGDSGRERESSGCGAG